MPHPDWMTPRSAPVVPTSDSEAMQKKYQRRSCNRCRSQRVRCQRTSLGIAFGKCDRCTRAHVECVVGPGRRMGRPPRQPPHLTPQEHIQTTGSKAPVGMVESHANRGRTTMHTGQARPEYGTAFLTPQSIRTPMMSDTTGLSGLHDGGVTSTPLVPDTLNFAQNFPMSMPTGIGNNSAYMDECSSSSATEGIDFNLNFDTTSFDSHLFRELLSLTSGDDESPVFECFNTKDIILQRLSRLHSALFNQLNGIANNGPGSTAEATSYHSQSAPLPGPPEPFRLFGSPSAHTVDPDDKYPVGQLLAYSQSFLNILCHFTRLLRIREMPKSGSAHKGFDSDSDSDSESDSISGSHDSKSRSSPAPCRSADGLNCSSRKDTCVEPNPEPNPNPPAPPVIDFPTMLILLTCYVSLVRMHRNIFTRILISIPPPAHKNIPSTAAMDQGTDQGQNIEMYKAQLNAIPRLVPETCLDNFPLKRHRSLQISIVLQICMDLLQRIARCVAAIIIATSGPPTPLPVHTGESSSSPSPSPPLPQDYPTLLTELLRQEVQDASLPVGKDKDDPMHQQAQRGEGAGGGRRRATRGAVAVGVPSLQILVKKIRKAVNASLCLLLAEATWVGREGSGLEYI
ncbi:hypothetical protein AJ80_06662 [Polytolypa hystricis UAMH7299]|uniref:Zn(2)-C6 fungal-type domain-containing protein n=1 Tax=Polytolypa hystricis (strain UAMH7299) TaxID=1447883 RepID=A0A2B7XLH7_POLH7|nr:hypothetical protein AJ80_06662 [Polytolypa hystricis UAMH7299]